MSTEGMVYLVGAGPGDPGLFTIRGKQCLERADVVIYDRLVSMRILGYAPAKAEMIYVGKASSEHTLTQDEINRLLVEKAQQGKTVVRLKGGDPFVFGRGGEEALYLRKHGVPFEIVPGVTSAVAVPAYAGIPVTHREMTSTLAIVTGHERPDKDATSVQWDRIATGIGTLVFLMGVENLAHIVRNLLAYGRDSSTPCAAIRWGTLPKQEVVTGTLADIEKKVQEANLLPPAILVVGEVVRLRQELMWFENRPLFGKRIVVTRSREQASQLSSMIEALGGHVVEIPTIKITPSADMSPLYRCFDVINTYHWLIFTSVNSVQIFFDEMLKCGKDIRDLKGLHIAAIGPATAQALKEKGLVVDVVPEEFRAEGIVRDMKGRIRPGSKVLLPRARGARDVLPEVLRDWGAEVTEVHLYQALTEKVAPEHLEALLTGHVDAITFTSSSTVKNFVKILGDKNIEEVTQTARVVCIGPVTAATAQEMGMRVDKVASEYTIPGLVQALVEMFQES
ncbi:MAG: uroporphyrinogen-III C-methyltransferase [Syntrophothermus sp.]|uniref:uroporphyrinogen-III C-methyltransferase n=1 Tax=Syntrophothermus sp. TaxID=2736299 RepID=UPI002579BC15|nr:uroporphyrinogen-III C-methyltransferase [Syntrophothermus sp.]NSW82006.1 uroporphyrinogen-III C-methyltransferase [Syntrophothermus sp.]